MPGGRLLSSTRVYPERGRDSDCVRRGCRRIDVLVSPVGVSEVEIPEAPFAGIFKSGAGAPTGGTPLRTILLFLGYTLTTFVTNAAPTVVLLRVLLTWLSMLAFRVMSLSCRRALSPGMLPRSKPCFVVVREPV